MEATIIIIIIVSIIIITGFIIYILNQKKTVKQWLLYAVVEAERTLGTKTGQLKLRAVFTNFLTIFPIFSKLISFDLFSSWVDEALRGMKEWLKNNETLNNYIKDNTITNQDGITTKKGD